MNLLALRGHTRAFGWARVLVRSRRQIVVAAAVLLALSPALSAPATASARHLFRPVTRPQAVASADNDAVNLGMRFRVTKPRKITGIRYYRVPGARGKTGALWSARGRLLATGTFRKRAHSGWRSLTFRTGVHVVPGRTYVASYLAPHGRYAIDEHGFDHRIKRGAIVAPKRAGVFAYGTRARFPTRRWHNSNYYVDVTFGHAHSGRRKQTASTSGRLPTADNAGVPAGWTPTRTINGDYTISRAGATLSDVRVNGNVIVNAPNVTIQRVEVVDGQIDNYRGPSCQNGLVVKDTTIRSALASSASDGALGAGGYTADNVKMEGVTEGFRVGGASDGCGPVVIRDSYAHVVSPSPCGDWHGDALQGYGGPALTVSDTSLWLDERGGCGGTAPFFYPEGQGNDSATIDGLVVRGGGYPFRLGTRGSVRDLWVVDNSWGYGPTDVQCDQLSSWSASVASLDSDGQPVPVKSLPCAG